LPQRTPTLLVAPRDESAATSATRDAVLISIGTAQGDVCLHHIVAAPPLDADQLQSGAPPFALELCRARLPTVGAEARLSCALGAKLLATVDNASHAVRLIALDTGRTLQLLPFHTAPLTTLACTRDGTILVAIAFD
jgi:hypothetical protein